MFAFKIFAFYYLCALRPFMLILGPIHDSISNLDIIYIAQFTRDSLTFFIQIPDLLSKYF